jgi:hypothetical protein
MLLFYTYLQGADFQRVFTPSTERTSTPSLRQELEFVVFTEENGARLFVLPLSVATNLFKLVNDLLENNEEWLSSEEAQKLRLPLTNKKNEDLHYKIISILSEKIDTSFIASISAQLVVCLKKMEKAKQNQDQDQFSRTLSNFFSYGLARDTPWTLEERIKVYNFLDYLAPRLREDSYVLNLIENDTSSPRSAFVNESKGF